MAARLRLLLGNIRVAQRAAWCGCDAMIRQTGGWLARRAVRSAIRTPAGPR